MFFSQTADNTVYSMTDPSGNTTVIDQADLTNLVNSGVDLSSYNITPIGTGTIAAIGATTAPTTTMVTAPAVTPALTTPAAQQAAQAAATQQAAAAVAAAPSVTTGLLGALTALGGAGLQYMTSEQLASKGISPYGLPTMIGPNGQLMYGYQTTATGNIGTILLIGGAALLAVMMLKKKKGGAAREED